MFVAHHDRCRLLGLRARADLEIDVRVGYAQLPEEIAGHALVVVLPGVHETHAQRTARSLPQLQRTQDRCDLHEVGPCAGNDVDRWAAAAHCVESFG